MNVFIPITKIDQQRREVWGCAAEESPDKAGEIMDYATSKPLFEEWSAQFSKQTGGESLGNVRAMHGNTAAGKLIHFEPRDDAKRFWVGAKVVDDAEWKKVTEKVYTGFSIGGEYAKRWTDPNDATLTRYTAKPSEISLVDNPCMYGAKFEVIKADGSIETATFEKRGVSVSRSDEITAVADQINFVDKLNVPDLQKAGARHSRVDLDLIQQMHDHAMALGAACATMTDGDDKAEKLTKSDDPDPDWTAYIAGCNITDTASVLAMLSGLAGNIIARDPEIAQKLALAAQIVSDALADKTNQLVAATEDMQMTDDMLQRIADAVMAKMTSGDDTPFNKAMNVATTAAQTYLTKAELDPLRKTLDEVATQAGALNGRVEAVEKVQASFGPVVREVMLGVTQSSQPAELAALDSLIARTTDPLSLQALQRERATLAIKLTHASGGKRIVN